MNKIKNTSNKIKVVVCRIANILWILAITAIGLHLLNIVTLPVYAIKASGIAMLITALEMLYKSSK